MEEGPAAAAADLREGPEEVLAEPGTGGAVVRADQPGAQAPGEDEEGHGDGGDEDEEDEEGAEAEEDGAARILLMEHLRLKQDLAHAAVAELHRRWLNRPE